MSAPAKRPEDPAGGTDGVGVPGAELRAGLLRSPPQLPAAYFYDAEGSRLFEEITRQPEYYLTGAERRLFETNAHEIADLAGPVDVVELGAGSSAKTRVLLAELLKRQGGLRYVPIDVSAAALRDAEDALVREFPELTVEPLAMRYRQGLHRLREMDRDRARLVLFIGSSIGNFEREEAGRFLRDLAVELTPKDTFLLGTDLAKDPATLNAAYNDPAGVTARFNLNVLRRLNREYGADFDLDQWEHLAFYHPGKLRVEMHLVSRRDQAVRVPGLDLELWFERGEGIHTENSHKFTERTLREMLAPSGLTVARTWTDADRTFAVHALRMEP